MELKINWKLAIFSVFFILVFSKLSVWQFDRAKEKTLSIARDEINRDLPGIGLDLLPEVVKDRDGVAVRLNGRFNPSNVFFLDNIVLNGKVGYEVLIPFIDNTGVAVLVNRGFIPLGKTRADVPPVPKMNILEQSIRGHLYISRSQGPADNFISGESSPYIVQTYDPARLAPVLKRELLGQILRIAEGEADALPRYWPVVVMLPEKHIGYAFTWLLMAGAVLIAFGAFTYQTNTYPTNSETENDI
ncbi:MAG: surfeit locus 1 family protein [Candidatus Azotimanducaceae bacterium]|jgi:surfeit locus 1 family protein